MAPWRRCRRRPSDTEIVSFLAEALLQLVEDRRAEGVEADAADVERPAVEDLEVEGVTLALA